MIDESNFFRCFFVTEIECPWEGFMAQGSANALSENQIALYTDDYYERSDLIFRFGALLSLSREGGERLTEETFRMLMEDFQKVTPATNAVNLLMALAWKAWQKLKSERFHEWQNPLIQSMKGLAPEARAVLFASEVAGLEISEIARLFGTDEQQTRRQVAIANKYITGTTIRV